MYELVQLNMNNYYIDSPTKVGLIRLDEDDVVIIDSGNDKDAGKKIRKILDENHWHLRSIINTHSHADHIGGNQYLQKQTNCKIYAPEIECDFACHPILEPTFLYGGNPIKELKHKFLMAQSSDVSSLTQDLKIPGVEILPLPGHSFNMVGVRTEQEVIYLADCLSSQETLQKYQISFLVDVDAYLETLNNVMDMKARWFVPAHAPVTDEIAPLVQLNIDKVYEIGDCIASICKTPMIFEDILQKIFEHFQLQMTFEQHSLIGSTIKSYLTWLKNREIMDLFIENNRMFWTRI